MRKTVTGKGEGMGEWNIRIFYRNPACFETRKKLHRIGMLAR